MCIRDRLGEDPLDGTHFLHLLELFQQVVEIHLALHQPLGSLLRGFFVQLCPFSYTHLPSVNYLAEFPQNFRLAAPLPDGNAPTLGGQQAWSSPARLPALPGLLP